MKLIELKMLQQSEVLENDKNLNTSQGKSIQV
jgi:hypothetical protein